MTVREGEEQASQVTPYFAMKPKRTLRKILGTFQTSHQQRAMSPRNKATSAGEYPVGCKALKVNFRASTWDSLLLPIVVETSRHTTREVSDKDPF